MKTLILCLGLTFALNKVNVHPWGGLVVDSLGNIYFTFVAPLSDPEHHYAAIWKLSDQGEITPQLVSGSSPSDLILEKSADGLIYAAERSGSSEPRKTNLWLIRNQNNDMVIAPTYDRDKFFIQAYAVAEDQTVYFAINDELFRRNVNGQVQIVPLKGITRISDLAWGPQGTLYILDQDKIKIMYPDGTISTMATGLKKSDPEDLPFQGANILFDMAVDQDGSVYLAYYGNRRVLKVSPTGNVSDLIHSGEWAPHGIDVIGDSVFILESKNIPPPWYRFWDTPKIVPRVRKVDGAGNVTVLYQ